MTKTIYTNPRFDREHRPDLAADQFILTVPVEYWVRGYFVRLRLFWWMIKLSFRVFINK